MPLAPVDVTSSLQAINDALQDALSASSDFAAIRAEIIRNARAIQDEADRLQAKRKRDDDAIVALLLA